MFGDGASNYRGSGAGVVLISPEGVMHGHTLRFDFNASNNEAEYKALLIDLKVVEVLEVRRLIIYDSQLMVNQINGDDEYRDSQMGNYI